MKATEQQLQEIYEEAVSAEIATQNGTEMALFDLLCKLDEVGGMANFIRSMIEQVRAANSDREMLKRLAVILSGSDAPGEIRSLTVTAQSFVDRCKTLAKEREWGAGFPAVLPCHVFLEPGLRFGKGVHTRLMLAALQRREQLNAMLEAMTPEERAEYEADVEDIKAMFRKPDAECPECGDDPKACCPSCQLMFAQPQGFTVRENGEANSYTLLRDGNWFANILMNGEMTVPQQWDFLNTIAKKQ